MVQVTADSEDISNKTDSFFKDFDLVVATNCSADQLVGSKNFLTIRLWAWVFYEQIVNEAQLSWLLLVENEGE